MYFSFAIYSMIYFARMEREKKKGMEVKKEDERKGKG